MSVTAIISEYNPFHNGHKYHIEQSKEITHAEYVIALMSGNFVQRGDIAILPKHTRARMCLDNGIDICMEIPIYRVLSSAQGYACGAIRILDRLGVDSLCFGSECGDIGILQDIAQVLATEPDKYKTLLRDRINSGFAYAQAVSMALVEYTGEDEFGIIMREPNNILGIEYLKALILLKSSVRPFTIKRKSAPHNCTIPDYASEICSASALRELVARGGVFDRFVPDNCVDIVRETQSSSTAAVRMADIFNYICLTKDNDYFTSINQSNEFVSNKILNNHPAHHSIDEIALSLKSKDISFTRIKRILLSAILGITKEDMKCADSMRPYVRLLGLRKNASHILRTASDNPSIDLLSNWSQSKSSCPMQNALIDKEIMANNLYYYLTGDTVVEQQKKIIIR